MQEEQEGNIVFCIIDGKRVSSYHEDQKDAHYQAFGY